MQLPPRDPATREADAEAVRAKEADPRKPDSQQKPGAKELLPNPQAALPPAFLSTPQAFPITSAVPSSVLVSRTSATVPVPPPAGNAGSATSTDHGGAMRAVSAWRTGNTPSGRAITVPSEAAATQLR